MIGRRLGTWPHRFLYCACGVAIVAGCAAYYLQRWTSYPEFSQEIDPVCKATYCDFRYYYYPQAQQIRDHDTPVKKYYYSPTFALLLLPLGKMPLDDALVAWTWVQALSLLLLIVASVLLLRGQPRWTHALLVLLTLTAYPVLHNWKWGQANTTFMALIVLGLALAERGYAKLAALALSLVMASRYFPALYALALVVRRRRKAVVWLVVYVALLLVTLPILSMGAEHAWNFYTRSATSIVNAATYIAKSRTSQYLPTVVLRLADEWGHYERVGSRQLWVVGAAALAACNAAAALWARYKRVPHPTLWAFCFIALSTPLLAITSWMHYFVYLPLAQTFLLAQLATLRGFRWLRAAGFALVWLPSAALASVFSLEPAGGARLYAQRGYLLLANLALLALSYSLLALSSRTYVEAPEVKRGNARKSPLAVPSFRCDHCS